MGLLKISIAQQNFDLPQSSSVTSDVMLEGTDFSMGLSMRASTLFPNVFLAGTRNGRNCSVQLDEGRDAERSSLLSHPRPQESKKAGVFDCCSVDPVPDRWNLKGLRRDGIQLCFGT